MQELGRFDDEKAAALAYDRCVRFGVGVGFCWGGRLSCIE
jgi:hypothetical protein